MNQKQILYYKLEEEKKKLNEDAEEGWRIFIENVTSEEMAIYAEEDRLYLKSLKQELTDEEDHNMCGGLR